MANLDKLVSAGVVSGNLKDEEKNLIEKLSPEEVSALISAHKKIGGDTVKKLNSSGNFIL